MIHENIFNIPIIVFGQINLKGIVLDSIDHQSVPFATVFINGTTKGNITDLKDAFVIKGVSLPAQIIVSHIFTQIRWFSLMN